MSIHILDKAFLDQFQITGFFQSERRGGQKVVYFPIINGENCVLKFFPGGRDARFERELEIYEKFKNLLGITKVTKVDIYGKDILVFEEFIPGETLNEILPDFQSNAARISQLIKDLIKILEPIWKQRYVHRDLKPENIIIQGEGNPIIIDFGIARDLDADSITGTGWQPKSWRMPHLNNLQGTRIKFLIKQTFSVLDCWHTYSIFKNSHLEILRPMLVFGLSRMTNLSLLIKDLH